MDPNMKQVWNPLYLPAVEEVIVGKISYTTQDDIVLRNTADLEAWEPSEDILRILPHACNIEVELISKEISLDKLEKRLLKQRDVGLIVMGPVIGRKTQPSLIVLATKTKLYVIDPKDPRPMNFLKTQLRQYGLRFWVTNALEEADSLFGNFGVNLTQANAQVISCNGLEIYLLKMLKYKTDAVRSYFGYAAQKISSRHHRARLNKFEYFVETWLDIDRADIEIDKNQLPHLKPKELNLTALNLIKKRCILVVPLGKKLMENCWFEAQVMSRGTFRMLFWLGKNDKTQRNNITDGIDRATPKQKPKYAYSGYYHYLDFGNTGF